MRWDQAEPAQNIHQVAVIRHLFNLTLGTDDIMQTCIFRLAFLLCSLALSGCTVLAIADVAVSTTVKVGGAVVGTAIDVTKAGVNAVADSSSK